MEKISAEVIKNEMHSLANNFLAKASIMKTKPERKKIAKMGFSDGVNSIGFSDGDSFGEKIVELSKLYPYKIISMDEILEVCRKYKLSMGRSPAFNDKIPEKNVKEIAGFKLLNIEHTVIERARNLSSSLDIFSKYD